VGIAAEAVGKRVRRRLRGVTAGRAGMPRATRGSASA
jgi:hypothetical protein